MTNPGSTAKRSVIFFCIVFGFAVQPADCSSGLTLMRPMGHETYKVGDTMLIQWQLDSSAAIKDALVIEISPDNGISFVIIERLLVSSTEFTARQCRWQVADSVYHSGKDLWIHLISDSCRLYVHGYSNYGVSDRPQVPFAIVASSAAQRSIGPQARPSARLHRAELRIAGARRLSDARAAGRTGFFMIDGKTNCEPPSRNAGGVIGGLIETSNVR